MRKKYTFLVISVILSQIQVNVNAKTVLLTVPEGKMFGFCGNLAAGENYTYFACVIKKATAIK
jgi:hypothetical protein